MKKRKLEVVVLSDVHLGSHECHADELLSYLSSIQPNILILNGHIIDKANKENYYFPSSHLNVVRKILSMASKGTEVYYIMANHDESFGDFTKVRVSNIKICNKLSLKLNGKKAWFFHGDIFDLSITKTKWIAQMGTVGFKFLGAINRMYSWWSKIMGKEKQSLSRKFKSNSKKTQKYLLDFQNSVAELAIANNFDFVVCGHLHKPKKELVETKQGSCLYLNSGDWVENLTALEYSFKRWKIYHYNKDKLSAFFMDEELKEMDINQLIASITSKNETKKKRKNEGKITEN